jgi:hypothetical protein
LGILATLRRTLDERRARDGRGRRRWSLLRRLLDLDHLCNGGCRW